MRKSHRLNKILNLAAFVTGVSVFPIARAEQPAAPSAVTENVSKDALTDRPTESESTQAELRAANQSSDPLASEGQMIEGLGQLSLEDGTIKIKISPEIKPRSQPEINSYLLSNGGTIFDLSFPGVLAAKGGVLELTDATFEKITLGKNKLGDVLLRIHARAGLGDIRQKTAFSADFQNVSLGKNIATLVSEKALEPMTQANNSVPPLVAHKTEIEKVVSEKALPDTNAIELTSPQKVMPDKIAFDKPADGPHIAATMPAKETGIDSQLWQGITTVAVSLAAFGFLGFALVRLRKRGVLGFTKQEKHMDIVSSLSLSPKRQVLLLKIRDQEIAVACTEHGIQFLTEIGGKKSQLYFEEESPSKRAKPDFSKISTAPISPKIIPEQTDSRVDMSARATQESSDGRKKADILLETFKQMKDKKPAGNPADFLKAAAQPRKPQPNQQELAQPDEPTPALSQTRAKFPKYLANAFDQEQRRPAASPEAEDSVESVTSMIREKLKSMQPLS